MITLKILRHPKLNNETFLVCLPSNNFYTLGSQFQFLEYGNESLINNVYLISKETIDFENITPLISFMDKNCNVELHKTILKNNFYFVKDLSKIDVLVFTKKQHVLTQLDVFNKVRKLETYKGLTPQHKIISKDYYHDPKKDYAQTEICPECSVHKLKTKIEISQNCCLVCKPL